MIAGRDDGAVTAFPHQKIRHKMQTAIAAAKSPDRDPFLAKAGLIDHAFLKTADALRLEDCASNRHSRSKRFKSTPPRQTTVSLDAGLEERVHVTQPASCAACT